MYAMQNVKPGGSDSTTGNWKLAMGILVTFLFITSSVAFAADVLFVVGKQRLKTVDEKVMSSLIDKGYNVVVREDKRVRDKDLAGKDLVIISDSVVVKWLKVDFRETQIPIICTEALLFDNLGMTNQAKSEDYGRKTHQQYVTMVNSDHPLAASLSNDVQVSTEGLFIGWGVPGKEAIKIATMMGDPSRYTIFAYDAGARMQGPIAPAKRVGFYLSNKNKGSITQDGWALFDAAVDWAVAEPTMALAKVK
jgi:hypothetical protein